MKGDDASKTLRRDFKKKKKTEDKRVVRKKRVNIVNIATYRHPETIVSVRLDSHIPDHKAKM